MSAAGPAAPTLCEGWTVRDLAAHIIVRERRLDATPGIFIRALEKRTERIQDEVAARPWEEILETIRTGPPAWSPFNWMDSLINTAEMFVHHEDVRRAGSGWEPRPLSDGEQAALWRIAGGVTRMTLRGCPVDVVLTPEDGALPVKPVTGRGEDRGTVTVSGTPAEILLWLYGRAGARVVLDGTDEDLAELAAFGRAV